MANLQNHVPVSKVDLYIQCQDLLDKDVMSKSDPCVVFSMQNNKSKIWHEIGRTETIQNCLNPKFIRNFAIDYFFEEVQNLKFAVYDIDNDTESLNDDDFLGYFQCTLAKAVSLGSYTGSLLLKENTPAGNGKITITVEEISGVNDVLTLEFSGQKLDDLDFFSKSDPYLVFSRQSINGTWHDVHRTEVVKNNLNPKWKPITIKSQKLCGGNIEQTIKVECYDYDDDGSHDFIGSFSTNVTELMSATEKQIKWPCINPKKKAKKKKYKDSGTIILHHCKIVKEYSFLDFIFGGLQIGFTVAIDFTASNGDPRLATSLHYNNPHNPNNYVQAIQSVGSVIQDYDSDKMFPTLGFGAKLPPDYYSASHEFAVNFQINNPYCAGIQGIIDAYKSCIQQVTLYGPTNFSPIIYHVTKFATEAHKEQFANNYFILLIVTDGCISDMNETLEAIVYASSLPMSIIIIGVGDADFESMDILDGDDGLLKTARGLCAKRDIVQFVPFNQFKNSAMDLAREVLAEVPTQVTDYYRIMNIPPSKRNNIIA